MPEKFDFSGWATRNDLKCSDGRTIRRNAFAEQNGKIVPLVWMHQHNAPENVLGHALLENRKEGVYAYCKFNDTESGEIGKKLVAHKDIVGLSIYANQLKQNGKDVLHGAIREVSLVIAGANPGATIDSVMMHGETDDEAMVLETYLEHDGLTLEDGEVDVDQLEAADIEDEPVEEPAQEEPAEAEASEETIEHADKPSKKDKEEEVSESKEETSDADSSDESSDKNNEGAKEMPGKEKTVQEVFDTLTEEQKNVVYALIGQAIEDAKKSAGDDEGEEMKHNVFDEQSDSRNYLSHADKDAIMATAKRYGSLKDAFMEYAEANSLSHADGDDDETPAYGITGIDALFPDAKAVTQNPAMLSRSTDWVSNFLNGAKHTPFARIKSLYADITADDARAKGYLKGTEKKDEVFPLFHRITSPTTVYKHQKLDRDDLVDIDFDVIPWLKSEMRVLLNEEIARAALVGDGRSASSPDKINEQNIRPIYKDTEQEVYAYYVPVTYGKDENEDAKNLIRSIIKARKNYHGSGKPTLYTTEDNLTSMLLLEDSTGRALYESEAALATKLRVKEIVTVEVMDGMSRTAGNKTYNLAGIVVNPADYTFGADKGGGVNLFDDFDIDFNQMKYLIETRCSGALTVPKSAMIVEFTAAETSGNEGNDQSQS